MKSLYVLGVLAAGLAATTLPSVHARSGEREPSVMVLERTADPLLRADRPWEDFSLSYCQVLRVQGAWHLWYMPATTATAEQPTGSSATLARRTGSAGRSRPWVSSPIRETGATTSWPSAVTSALSLWMPWPRRGSGSRRSSRGRPTVSPGSSAGPRRTGCIGGGVTSRC